MTGHRPFSELTKDWPPERRRRVEEGTARLSAEVEAALAAERAAKRGETAHQPERANSGLAQQGPKASSESARAR